MISCHVSFFVPVSHEILTLFSVVVTIYNIYFICLLSNYLLDIFSVPLPFKGDYIGLPQNPKWQKLYQSSDDSYVVFADNVMKINRADGKVSKSAYDIKDIGRYTTSRFLLIKPETGHYLACSFITSAGLCG